MRAGIIAVGLGMALCIYICGVELQLTGITLRQFDLEYSLDLTNWHWWGSMVTTSAVGRITLDAVTTNGVDVRFWRVVPSASSNVWTASAGALRDTRRVATEAAR